MLTTRPALDEAISRARELHRKALVAGHAGRTSAEARILRSALAVLDRVEAEVPSGDVEWLRARSRLLITLAFIEAELGTLADGLAHLARVRPRIDALPDGPVRDELLGALAGNHASMLLRTGQHEASIPLLETSIKHKRRSLDLGADEPERMIDSLVGSVSNLGKTYGESGHPGPAITYLNQAIELGIEHGLTMKVAYAKHALADLQARVGELPDALRLYGEAELIYQELAPDVLPRLRLDQAQALLMAGLADEAGAHLDEALPEMRKSGMKQDLAEAEALRATAALAERDFDTGRRLSRSAQRRFLRRGSEAWSAVAALTKFRVDVARALARRRIPSALSVRAEELAAALTQYRLQDEASLALLLGARLEIRRGNSEKAAELLGKVSRARLVTPIEQRMLLRLCKAELAVLEGNRRTAFAQARAGLNELGRARDRMGGLELVSATSIHGHELGDLAVRLVLDGGRSAASARQLFDWLEHTRAQAYRYEPVSGLDDPQLVRSITEIRNLGHTLRQAKLDGRPTAKLQARYTELQRAATRLGWHAASRWGRPRPIATVAEVSEQLGDRVLISFATSGDMLLAVVILHGRARIVRLGSAERAAERTRRLHADMNAMAPDHLPEPLLQAISNSARKEADLLDAQLLLPLAAELGDREVVIVPTGELYAVPWNVLGSLRYRPIVVAPSATAWLTASRTEADTEGTILVRGPNLLAAPGEIDKLAAHHGSAQRFFDASADVRSVLGALDGANLAHIAAHGSHEPDNALFSRLELSDGALFAHEVAALRRPPKQVVLSACELALNLIRPGDEALGFAGALLASGTSTVVAAASKVGDQPTAATMDDYHRALAGKVAPAVALADAVGVDPLRRPFVCLGTGDAL